MKAAHISTSPRLQRVHALLADGRERSTLDIVNDAHVCAVNSCISELRTNGAVIGCRQIKDRRGQRIWLYKMTSPVPEAA